MPILVTPHVCRVTRQYTVNGTMTEARESELRINEQDREAIKTARDELFDRSTALGFVARYACEQLTDEEETGEASGVRL